MRTSIDIDRELVEDVMHRLRIRTIREAVDLGLKELRDREDRLRAIEQHFQQYPDFELPPDDPRG